MFFTIIAYEINNLWFKSQQFMVNLLSIIEDIYDDMIGRLNQCETGRDVGEALGPLEEIDPVLFRQLMGYLDEQIDRNNNSYDFDPTELIQNITPILNNSYSFF